MNPNKLIELINNPNSVLSNETIALESVLEDFPYFQTARVLHLKGLKNQNSFKYNSALKATAAYTTNRTVLFDFITNNSLDFDKQTSNEKDVLNEINVIDSKVVDHLHNSIIASENKNNLFMELQQIKNLEVIKTDLPKKEIKKIKHLVENEKTLIDNDLENKLNQNKEVLEMNKPFDFKKGDSHSFNEWLQLSPIKPIIRKTKASSRIKEDKNLVENTIEKENSLNLIAEFIKNKPKIKPIKGQKNTNIAIDSTLENTNLMTETLARVYLEQKKYKKAITAFKILSLKYPEKSSFFADRIKAIKFLEKHKS